MTAQLASVPASTTGVQPRALGYVRVSTAREDMISPELQTTAIRDYCGRMGYRLVDVAADLDQSGRSFARAEVQKTIARVEAGEADVVVVWKVSRFGRNRRDWYVNADRLEVAGGRLESATEGFDAATSVGKFTRGMLVELAAFESDRIGDVWREVQDRRFKAGLTHNGRARFGYVYDKDTGRHEPDPETGPILAALYRRYLAGEGPYTLAQDLNRRGVRTTTGGLWTDGSLRRMLDSGFGAGLVRREHRPKTGQARTRPPEWLPGAHEPVITSDEWEQYRATKRDRSKVAPRTHRSPYLLSGIVFCGVCEGRMTGGTFGNNRTAKYRCERRRGTGGVGCQAGYVACSKVHPEVLDWLRDLADDVDGAARRAATSNEDTTAQAGRDAARLAREVTRLETALVRLTQAHAEDPDSDDAVFRLAREDYQTRLATAREAHEAATRAARPATAAPQAIARHILTEWPTLGVEGKRDALRQLVRAVKVTPRGRGTPPVVDVVPLWESV